jgi:hypothetical protein
MKSISSHHQASKMNDTSSGNPHKGTVKITKASLALQKKAGTGDISPELIHKAEKVLHENAEDFTPLALELLNKLRHTLDHIKASDLDSPSHLQTLVAPIMQLKANGRMFKYDLITILADTMLAFLESIKRIDPDVIYLAEAHLASLQVIIAKKIKGSGGASGQHLQQELEEAVQRYYKKNPQAAKTPRR